ncbi:MAG: hypothetical protein GXP56_14840 [Deltaproteobacteria bacterium]|nr:hypothetical protein [Deltaproteobacteria bacterium]
MTSGNIKPANGHPDIDFKANAGLIDHYCPFCDKKLFKGNVASFNMVCSNCNKLVRSQKDYHKENKTPL